MRKIYTFLFLLIAATSTTRAQRFADLELLSTMIGTSMTNLSTIAPYDTLIYDDSTKYYIKWTIINHGSDSVHMTDTFCIKSLKGIIFRGNVTIPPGDTVALSPLPSAMKFKPPVGSPMPYIDTLIWCDSIWAFAGPMSSTSLSDPDMTNNSACKSIVASSVKQSADVGMLLGNKPVLQLYPNPASEKLTAHFELNATAKDVRLLIRNTVGQVVYSHNAGNVSGTLIHSINVGDLSPGFYLAELHYNEQVMIRKVAIQ